MQESEMYWFSVALFFPPETTATKEREKNHSTYGS